MKLPVIYIAGPFRAINSWEVEQNIRHAEEVALEVWRSKAVALCPHTMHRFFQGYLYPSFTGNTVRKFRSPEAVSMWEYFRKLWEEVNPR